MSTGLRTSVRTGIHFNDYRTMLNWNLQSVCRFKFRMFLDAQYYPLNKWLILDPHMSTSSGQFDCVSYCYSCQRGLLKYRTKTPKLEITTRCLVNQNTALTYTPRLPLLPIACYIVGVFGSGARLILAVLIGCVTTKLISWLQIVGACFLLWGTLFVRGWEIETNCGVTFTERVNQWLYRFLYCVGTAVLVCSLVWTQCTT